MIERIVSPTRKPNRMNREEEMAMLQKVIEKSVLKKHGSYQERTAGSSTARKIPEMRRCEISLITSKCSMYFHRKDSILLRICMLIISTYGITKEDKQVPLYTD